MASFNKVILMGNLTRDPEKRTLPSGSSIAAIGLATNRSYKKDGEEVEETTFLDIDAFGRQAEVICQYLHKGDPVMVEGRLRYRSWEDESGQKRNKLSVVLERFEFLPRGERKEPVATNSGDPDWSAKGGEDDNIPF